MRTVIRYEDSYDGLGIWLLQREKDGIYKAKPVVLEFEKMKDYPILDAPTIMFPTDGPGKEFLSDMANGLAKLGFLPDLAKRNEAELAAVRSHLEDMRTITFDRLKILTSNK